MTRWIEELPPQPEVPRRTLVEWLIRSFQSMSRWSERTHDRGYGGLDVVTAHTRLNGPIPQVTAAIPGTAYDVVAASEPIDVSQDLANGRLIVTEGGIWVLSMGLVCEVDGFSGNDTAEVALGLYDETAGEPLEIPVTGVVPRYGTYLSLTFSGMYEVDPARVGHELSLHWVQVAGPILSVEETHLLHFTLHRVG